MLNMNESLCAVLLAQQSIHSNNPSLQTTVLIFVHTHTLSTT